MSEASRITSQCQPASTGAALCTYVRTYALRSCLARFLQLSSCSFLMAIHRHGHLPEAISQGAHQSSEARACTYIARALHTYVRTLLGIFRGFAALVGAVRAMRAAEK